MHIILELGEAQTFPSPPPTWADDSSTSETLDRPAKRRKPSIPSVTELENGYLDSPLLPNKKIAIRMEDLRALMTKDCDESVLETLFRPTASPLVPLASLDFVSAVDKDPPINGSGMISFWDANIRTFLERFAPGGTTIRDSRYLPDELRRPDFVYILRGFCPFRGEESEYTDDDGPENRLANNVVWSFDPLEYVFGISSAERLID